MILSDVAIRRRLEQDAQHDALRIEPFRASMLQSASVDLHLGRHFLRMLPDQTLDMQSAPRYEELHAKS